MRNQAKRLASASLLAFMFATGTSPPAEAAPCWEDYGIEPLNLLFWSKREKLCGYMNMEHLWASNAVSKGNGPPPPPMPPKRMPLLSGTDEFMKENDVNGLLVMHKGAVIHEQYREGLTESRRWTSFSMAKSLTALLAGAAVADGHIRSLDDKIAEYLPELAEGAYAAVTIRQILTMTSGVAWNENYRDRKSDVAKLANLAEGTDKSFLAYMASRPRMAPAGTTFNYSTGEAGIVGQLVRRATGKSLSAVMSGKIWSRIGAEQDAGWITDRSGSEVSGCCFSATLRDYGKVGQFMLSGGRIGEEAVLPSWWMREMTTASKPSNAQKRPYGFQIWVRDNGSYQASGIFGQMIHVDPERELVIVMLSAWDTAVGTAEQHTVRRAFIAKVKKAVSAPGKKNR